MTPLWIEGDETPASVTARISDTVLVRRPGYVWWGAAFLAFAFLQILLLAITWLLLRGVGIWGVQIPVAWGFAIVNFVWWIGIGHAGTFISAILLLLHQDWRTSINRFAEAMTLFAVACAGLFPLLHLGRPWFFYWLLPYPDTMSLWPQFRSPLVWDVFAVSTYAAVSLIFWYLGLLPDFATLRDRARRPALKRGFAILSLGWRGSGAHWKRYRSAYVILAGLATPLVVSVHSVVSLDFTTAILPGWHSTIFPPYFVAGAIFSGFAMVLTLGIPLRRFYGLKSLITVDHLDACAKLLLTTGLLVDYGYLIESFWAWYGKDAAEAHSFWDRATGVYAPVFWTMIFCNVLVTQLLWYKRVRRSPGILFAIALAINLGMWLERFVIVVASLHDDFIPTSWRDYEPTIWDYATLVGSLGLFFFLFLLFAKGLPVASMAELRELAVRRPKREEGPAWPH